MNILYNKAKIIILVIFCVLVLCIFFERLYGANTLLFSSKTSIQTKNVLPKPNSIMADSRFPNIVMIQIDSLRADHLGVYGYNKNTTPFLDTLAVKGIVFENMYAVAPFTCQNDATVLTGVYPSQNNIIDWNRVISNKYPLLPKILSYYGYKTFAYVSPGLWGSLGFGSSFDSYEVNANFKNLYDAKFSVASSSIFSDKPFFAFWHIYDVHLPYMAASKIFYPKEYGGKLVPLSDYFLLDDSLRNGERIATALFPWTIQTVKGLGKGCYVSNVGTISKPVCSDSISLLENDKEYIIASYDTGVNYVDRQLNDFFDLIKDQPFFDNTLFIISSDHGEDHGEHGIFFHGDIYNSNIHIPLIFYYNKLTAKKINENVSNIDILPTVLSLIGITPPSNIEGKDFSGLISGGKYDDNRPIFTERAPFNEYSVIKGKWKYILRDKNRASAGAGQTEFTNLMLEVIKSDETYKGDELYELSSDPLEQLNMIGKGYQQENELKELALDFKKKMLNERKNNNESLQSEKITPRILSYP
jgi:phosphoglycerol transferase MdoB-like AlkP superfamily enzyme